MQVDRLNTLLIILSLGLSILLPFELFLIGYAVLGPLHYFTEINWIRDRRFFISSKAWVYAVMIIALLITLPYLVRLDFAQSVLGNTATSIEEMLNSKIYTTGYFLIIALGFVLLFLKKWTHRVLALLSCIILAFLLNDFSFYHIILGIFLPTLIHVYLFTLLFMYYGFKKSKNTFALLNCILMILVPVAILLLPLNGENFFFDSAVEARYTTNNFHLLNTNISKYLGINDGSTFNFRGTWEIKIQIFITFAYIYHYLNWFSKTTVIGWHKNMTKQSTLLIAAFWIISIILYAYDYALGFTLLLFVSLVHVFLELPLNYMTLRSIFKK